MKTIPGSIRAHDSEVAFEVSPSISVGRNNGNFVDQPLGQKVVAIRGSHPMDSASEWLGTNNGIEIGATLLDQTLQNRCMTAAAEYNKAIRTCMVILMC
jgi:hypothetical protein